MTTIKQSTFSGGLVGPQLLGRSDLAKYQTGCRTLRNFIVTRNGSVENRPGTVYTATVKNSANPTRLVKFVSTTGQGILLEFGANYVRFYKNGAPISVVPSPAPAWDSSVTYQPGQYVNYLSVYYIALQSNTNVVPSSSIGTNWSIVLMTWSNVAAYAVGDLVFNAANSTYYYCIQANTGQQPNLSPSYWYAQTGTILEVPTVIPQNALASMQSVQLNDIMVLTNQLFYPQQLNHYSDTHWTIANFSVNAGIGSPTSVIVTAGNPPAGTVAAPSSLTALGGLGGTKDRYLVTAFTNSPAAESAVSNQAQASGGQATNANPVALSWNAVGGASGYAIYKSANPAFAAGPWYIIGISNSNAFSDNGIGIGTPIKGAPSGSGSYTTFNYVVTAVSATTGLEGLASSAGTAVGGTPSSATPNTISWASVSGASSYNIYELVNGVYGFIGSSSTTSFSDINYTPDTSKQPPVNIGLFQTTNDYPAVVGAYQQRLLFANTINQPQTVWGSSTASYQNFTTTVPVLDSGAFQFTIAGRSRQYVQSLVDIGRLVIHTSAGEYVANGNAFNTITPTAINLVQNGYAGSSLIVPVSIGTTDLFVQARGNMVRDLQYSIYTTTYTGKDTTLYAPQLFEGNTISQLDWQQVYNSIVWIVQSNGALLGLTYSKDQDMWAWHQHDTYGGLVEQVCVVPEGTADTVYLIVKRTINGATARYIERLSVREFQDTQYLTDAIFCDCALTYDGRNTTSTTMTTSTSGGWTPQDTITLTASGSFFSVSDVGNAIMLRKLATGVEINPATSTPYPIGWVIDSVRFDIIGYTSATVVTTNPSKAVPTWAQATATTSWGKMVHSFSGAGVLEGQTIVAQGDGTRATPSVVTGGTFNTGTKNYLVLTAGIGITSQLQTMPVEGGQRNETLLGRQVLVSQLTPMFYSTIGGQYGQDFSTMYPVAFRGAAYEQMGQPVALFTGPFKIDVSGSWETTGQVCIQQTDPFPMAISAVAVTTFVGS